MPRGSQIRMMPVVGPVLFPVLGTPILEPNLDAGFAEVKLRSDVLSENMTWLLYYIFIFIYFRKFLVFRSVQSIFVVNLILFNISFPSYILLRVHFQLIFSILK